MIVALRKESVDRNAISLTLIIGFLAVALRKESVDRNIHKRYEFGRHNRSLSARRAWIEMLESKQIDPSVMVALRKESVDRNTSDVSANEPLAVALRKESVDRNDNNLVL